MNTIFKSRAPGGLIFSKIEDSWSNVVSLKVVVECIFGPKTESHWSHLSLMGLCWLTDDSTGPGNKEAISIWTNSCISISTVSLNWVGGNFGVCCRAIMKGSAFWFTIYLLTPCSVSFASRHYLCLQTVKSNSLSTRWEKYTFFEMTM